MVATDPMFLRLVGGNTANPELTDRKVSGHDFVSALQMWRDGIVTKQDIIDEFDFTHGDDSGDLDSLKQWYDAATKQDKFANHLEWRLILARRKRGPNALDGAFGYAVKSTFVNGADNAHSLENTGPAGQQFNAWA